MNQPQQKSATGKPIPKEELWKSISTAHQAGKPAAQAPAEAIEANETTEAPVPASQLEAQSLTPAAKESSTSAGQPINEAPLNDDDVIALLAAMKPMEYDRVRLEHAKALGVQVSTLDSMVKKARNEEVAARLPFSEVEPHPEPIDPAQLLREISDITQQYIVLEPEQADAAALWIAFTYFIDVVEVAPLAIINAPEKSCGKTQLLTLIGRMAYRPLPASNASASALFRAAGMWKPTILIDEADTFFRDNFELQGMVNAGYLREGYVLRSESSGDSYEPRMFSVFSPKAIAGIALERHLRDATMSRGILFNLRRKLSHESVSRLRHANNEVFKSITAKLVRFALDYSQQVRLARPSMPDELSDRDQDNWDPLLAIAGCAGPEWVQRATAAALKLSCEGVMPVSTGNELLADVRHIFEKRHLEKIGTADLIEALCDDEEGGWATYNRGKPITPRQLAKQLSGYGIKSKTVRMGANNTPKGFDKAQFADAFTRYLAAPEKMPQQRNVSPEPMSGMETGVADEKGVAATGSSGATREPSPVLDCGGVAGISVSAGRACLDADDLY